METDEELAIDIDNDIMTVLNMIEIDHHTLIKACDIKTWQPMQNIRDMMDWGFMNIDNPGDFSNRVGYDLYVNPWWALRRAGEEGLSWEGCLVDCMGRTLGQPDLWFNGGFHELLWGPRSLHRVWRPRFSANLSATSGRLHRHMWLPWRATDMAHYRADAEPVGVGDEPNIVNCNVDCSDVAADDVARLESYAVRVDHFWGDLDADHP